MDPECGRDRMVKGAWKRGSVKRERTHRKRYASRLTLKAQEGARFDVDSHCES